ncbi:MAG: pentapeptide repeat-containing protein [Cyanobacteria bacterium P01_F01_bin.53]
MSDIDFLALVEQGVERWNQWRTDNPTVRPDLSHAYLFGHSLAKFDLSHTNLERACLIGADLQGANLHCACLQSAYGSSANFNGANLSEANLNIGSFGEANFSNANLSKATVYGTNFSSACFSGSCLLAWKIDGSTVLSGIKASHVYLQTQQQQRQPQTGQFQPGALEPFLRLVDVQQSSMMPQPVTSPRLSTAFSLKAPINSTAIKASVERFKAGTIHQANRLLSDSFRSQARAQFTAKAKDKTAQISLLTQCFIQPENWRQISQRLNSEALVRIRAVNDSAVAKQLRVKFTPDAVDRITPGALHQLSPETVARIHTLLKLEELTALRLAAIQGSTRARVGALNQLQAFVYSDPLKGTRAIALSVVQSAPVHRAIQPFKPDGVNQVTPGALSHVDIRSISAEAFEQVCHQITILFTPDAVDRVTPGALHQLSPKTRARIHTLLQLETVSTLQENASNAGHKLIVVTTTRLSLLTHTAAFQKANTLLKSPTAERLIHPFKPDGVDRVTPGSLPPIDLTGLKHITDKAQTYSTHAVEHIRQPEKRAQLFQWVRKLSNPKYLEENIKTLCEHHPRATGLSTAAVVAILTVNFVTRPTNSPVVTSNLTATQTHLETSKVTAQPTAPQTSNSQEATLPPTVETANLESMDAPPVSALEVASHIASVTMPCKAITTPVALNELENGHEYENGAVFYGRVANGQPADGTGTMVYPTGNRYDGEYQGGQRQGCGTFTFANKRRYIGQFEADKFNGQGTWIIENGERYIGEFNNNQCSGQGTFIFANGSSKSGTWQQGKLPNTALSCDRGSLDLPSSQDM